MPTIKLLLGSTFLVGLLGSVGCYRYVPSETSVVPPGTEVRVRLSESGEAEVRQYFGPGVTSVSGPLVRWNPEGLRLLTEMTVNRPGYPATFLADTIQLLPQHFSGVDVKELDGKRTLGFTAGVLGVMAGALIAAQNVGGSSRDGGGEGDGGNGPDASILVRLPLVRIPFGIGFR